jgi:hypothetical protein
MSPRPDRPPKLFVSFALEDQAAKQQLYRHLQPYVRRGAVARWSGDEVAAGSDWRREAARAADRADVALVMLSADYLASDHLMEEELPLLLDRLEAGARVIPVILRPCGWKHDPRLAGLLPRPSNGETVADLAGPDQDAFWTDLVNEIVGFLEPASITGELPTADRVARLVRGMEPAHQASIRGFLRAYTGRSDVPFCGRVADVKAVRAWFDRPDAPPNLLLTAPAGRGKSALLIRLAMALADRPEVGVAYVPISLRYGTNRPAVFLRCLAGRLCTLHGQPAQDLKKMSETALWNLVRGGLERGCRDGRTALIILDGLDEAAGCSWHGGLFPAGRAGPGRLIVSAREGPDDPDGRRWLQALGWESGVDATVVTLPLLGEADVERVIEQLPAPHGAWARLPGVVPTITELCKRDSLTLWFMLERLRKLRSPTELASWRPGLDQAFQEWWDEQRARWEGEDPRLAPASRALLHLLAVAKSGLTIADLRAVAGEELGDGLLIRDTVHQLSPIVCGAGTTTGYVLAHPGFADHLGRVLDLRTWRARLARYVAAAAEDLTAGRRAPDQVPLYAVLNRVAQLDADGAPLASWMQLCGRAWYDAWQFHEPGASGFLLGVNRAWDAVVASSSTDASVNLGEEARCALVCGSVGSLLAIVDARLLKLLLANDVWSPDKALAYLSAAPVGIVGSGGRETLIEALLPHAPPDLLPALFDVACGLAEMRQYRSVELLEQFPDGYATA